MVRFYSVVEVKHIASVGKGLKVDKSADIEEKRRCRVQAGAAAKGEVAGDLEGCRK